MTGNLACRSASSLVSWILATDWPDAWRRLAMPSDGEGNNDGVLHETDLGVSLVRQILGYEIVQLTMLQCR